jgi:hypothetical protein
MLSAVNNAHICGGKGKKEWQGLSLGTKNGDIDSGVHSFVQTATIQVFNINKSNTYNNI